VSKLSFFGLLLEKLSVASLSRPAVFFSVAYCYCRTVTLLWANKWWWWRCWL